MVKNTTNFIFLFFLVLTFLAGIFAILTINSNIKGTHTNGIKSYNEQFDDKKDIMQQNQSGQAVGNDNNNN